MAIDNFIPEVWSARLLMNLRKFLVYGQAGVVNRDYEGEINQAGDTVRINSIGPVTVGNYVKNTNIGDPETLTDSQQTLLIDQAKYFNFQVDGVMLTDAKVPQDGRWVVVPPWFYGLLLKDDRFVDASKSGSTDALRNGQVGRAAGFDVLQSHNVPNTGGTKYKIIAGHPMAISYAEQINKVEAYRPEKRFADAVKGLHLYGAKLVRPAAIAVLTANKA